MSDAVVVAVVTLVGVLVTATLAFMSNRNAKRSYEQAVEVNDAVNHRHLNEPRIFDVVKAIRSHQVEQELRMDVYDMKLDLIQEQVDHNGRVVTRLEREMK